MARNKLNKYILIYFVQEYTLKMQNKGLTKKRIYENILYVYPMSRNTFYNYLNVNVRKALRAMNVDMSELKKRSDYINSIIPE